MTKFDKELLYNKNINAFKQRYPQYFKMVENAKKNNDYKLRSTKTQFKTLYMESKDVSFYGQNPVDTCKYNNEVHGLHHCRLAIFLGFVLGYDILYYSEQLSLKNKTEKILIFEHDPFVVKLAMKCFNLIPIFKQQNIELIMVNCPDEITFKYTCNILLKNQSYYLLRSMEFLFNFEYFEVYKNIYIKIMDIFKRAAVHTIMYYGNDAKDSLIGIHNMFDNLKEIIENPGINLLKGKFKGVPAICVAAGPSLDKNIDLLKGLQDKAIIIAVDACLKPLLDKGIRPHLITSLEREIEVVDLFKGIKEDYSDVYFAGCPVVYNKVYRIYKGPRLIVYRQFDHFKWLEIDRGMLEIKVSPGNMNFKIAEYLGCELIILIGQDLALDGKRTNVLNTPLGESQNSYLNEPRLMVKGNYCDQIETTRSLNQMLEGFIIDVANYEGICINATEGGAHIEGTEIMPFKDAIELLDNNLTETPKKILDKYLKEFKVDTSDYKKVLNNCQKSIDHFTKSSNICKECIEWLELLDFDNANEKYIDDNFQKILEYKNKMKEDEFTWQLYFAHISQSVFISHEMHLNTLPHDNRNINDAKVKYLQNSTQFMKIIKGLIDICIFDLKREFEKWGNYYEKI